VRVVGIEIVIASLALLVSGASLVSSVKSARAANRSADAAEEANIPEDLRMPLI
jgi:hypothetical protein